ncbi:MAG: AraC family transcriptional regulator [Pyrinomonadaceae bacterium]
MIREKFDPPRGVLRSAADPVDGMSHRRFYPSSHLAEYVEHYWSVKWDLRGKEPYRAETLPHPSVHVVFGSDGSTTVGGPSTAKFSRLLEGTGGVFAAKFTPAGFYPFFRDRMSRLANRSVDFANIFPRVGEELARNVLSQTSEEDRIPLLEDFLRSLKPAPDPNIGAINRIVYAIAGDRDILRVDDLVDRYEISLRSLQRMFAKYVGVSPKWVIQRYRLHEAAEQLSVGSVDGYVDLALQLGYSDQSHFVRDFKAIVGVSPAAYVRANRLEHRG